MKAVRKTIAWPVVFATFVLAFASVTYTAARPLAVALERATWHVGLASRYHEIPTYSVTAISWALVILGLIAIVRWMGRRSLEANSVSVGA
jgi:hypothetical protein